VGRRAISGKSQRRKWAPPAQLKEILYRLHLHPKKGLGQHFLVDNRILEGIISAAELAPDDIVIEVGAGAGILTLELARRARQVLAVELDSELASALSQVVAPLSNIRVINADILQVTPAELLGGGAAFPSRYKVVANLPYYIASAVLHHFLKAEPKPGLMIVMVQKEVGEAIVAWPGGMSLLATCVQFYSKPSIIEYVPARSFYPPPKVDSVILRIVPYEQPLVKVSDTVEFFKLVRAGFSAPRKQLRNALAQGLRLSPAEAVALLEKAGIDPQRRAETLALQEWAKVYEVVAG
jgi:16S rRNA (adenine1518-N6/adenine1519-N6)-dimethyltransferase